MKSCPLFTFVLGVTLVLVDLPAFAQKSQPKPKPAPTSEGKPAEAGQEAGPFVAIWREHDGYTNKVGAPYLRIAIWKDGRVVFAKEPGKWNHELLEGKIEAAQVADLQKVLAATGVFELKRTSSAVPSAPSDRMLVALDGKQQLLTWDERETPGYGININPTPDDLKFIECWKKINTLALAATPKDSKAHEQPFKEMRASWKLQKKRGK